ncbi:hypothetical protein PGT21_030553 [Puccinia graminis f. sp. tritici]|uniref:Uncharacterized protein n=1 Tax=Puccinia graminis f. sp. tritici TaxID=56615 RepID=A0A5B0RNE7_PUCGR|nr:hypothetical protein PGT21_030553 [Puccinia graminis f. sp. tritici]KAA1126678.1 hypothetical protein PGTUg99_032663 [Puccinia graminis f. sp. tritici]
MSNGIQIWHFCALVLLVAFSICPAALGEENNLVQSEVAANKEAAVAEHSTKTSNIEPVSLKRRSPLPQGGCKGNKVLVKGVCVTKCKANQTRNAAGKCVKRVQ